MNATIDQEVITFFSQFPVKKYRKGEFIIEPDIPINNTYYLKSGNVREYSISQDGTEVGIHIFNPKTYFPMTAVIADVPNPYFFEALTDVEIIIAPKEALIHFLEQHPQVLLDLTKRILRALDRLSSRIEALTNANARERIVSILLYMARHFGEHKVNQVIIKQKFTHQEIGTLTGLTRETVSRELSRLEKEKLISDGGQQIIIKDEKGLKELISQTK